MINPTSLTRSNQPLLGNESFNFRSEGIDHLTIAKAFGYKENGREEMEKYFQTLLKSISTVAKTGYIEKKDLVYKERGSILQDLDCEATLNKLKDDEGVKPGFNKALLECAVYGQLETMRALLHLGADPNKTDSYEKTALMVVKWEKKYVQLLLEHDADPNIADISLFTPIIRNTSDPEITELLCKKGANVNHQTKLGNTALHFAVRKGHKKTVEVLLRYHADRTIENDEGKKPGDFADSRMQKLLNQTSLCDSSNA